MDDNQLIAAIAKKDNQAFKTLIDNYQRTVINLAYKFTHNHQDAEDIAQEVFFTVWKKAKKFRGESALSTWIHRITVNTSLNFLRKHKREKSDLPEERLMQEPAPGSRNPDQIMESEYNKEIFYKALEDLPEKYRIPFVLNKLEGMSYKEVAETLRISVPNVETRIHRAKKAMQESLIKFLG